MSTIIPQSELVRRAIEYVMLQVTDRNSLGEIQSKEDVYNLIEDACMRFNLSPKEGAALHHFIQPSPAADAGKAKTCGCTATDS